MLKGHCNDASANEPPRGMQLLLKKHAEEARSGTIVMSNLGYFQLQASPGVWELSLAPGRSTEVYAMEYVTKVGSAEEDETEESEGDEPEEQPNVSDSSASHSDSIEGNGTLARVALADFSGKTISLGVRKREGHENEDVLHDPASTSTLSMSLSVLLASKLAMPTDL